MQPVSSVLGVDEWPVLPDLGGAAASAVDDHLPAAWQVVRSAGRWPFDVARQLHAVAVQAGWLRNSLLEARDFERLLGAQERAILGPLARRV